MSCVVSTWNALHCTTDHAACALRLTTHVHAEELTVDRHGSAAHFPDTYGSALPLHHIEASGAVRLDLGSAVGEVDRQGFKEYRASFIEYNHGTSSEAIATPSARQHTLLRGLRLKVGTWA
jgi:hypothetical protein